MRRSGPLALLMTLALGCTTEFIADGGSCTASTQCESGQICLVVESTGAGLCLNTCQSDDDCAGLRGEVCRPLPEGGPSVCSLTCVVDEDCPAGEQCAFGRCEAPIVLVDGGPAPTPDAAPAADGGADAAESDAATDGGADAAESDAVAADGAVADASADAGVEPDAAIEPDAAAAPDAAIEPDAAEGGGDVDAG